jgi:hypothetical protein
MKIPTAKEFYDAHYSDDAGVIMRDFAKLHVEAALKEASEKSKVRKDTYIMGSGTTEVEQMFNYSNGTSHYVDQNSILNAYPLTNII